MTPTREQVIEWAKEAGLLNRAAFNHETELYRLCNLAFDAGRDQGLREAKEAFSLSDHMHKRNTGLMVCVSDLSAAIVRMAAGIDHLSEIARQWEPDHSSGAERRGWLLAKDARDDALELLKEHAAAIEQLRASA